MNMKMNKWRNRLEAYFDLSKDEQEKKHKKLLKIIRKLEKKKLKLEESVDVERNIDATSDRYHELSKRLKIIAKLIKKAQTLT